MSFDNDTCSAHPVKPHVQVILPPVVIYFKHCSNAVVSFITSSGLFTFWEGLGCHKVQ